MPYTNCKAHMEFIDTTAVADGVASSQDNAEIGSLELLKQEKSYPAYAIPDLNRFLLDGSREVLDAESRLPFVSDMVSGGDCFFAVAPVLTVTFTTVHTSAGITLNFVDDYPTEIRITWYDLESVKWIKRTFYPDGLKFFCRHQVENYGRVVIEFIKTRLPGQRVQLTFMKYGSEIQWSGSDIHSASITEEVDVTGATIPVNKAEISILDEANEFELANHSGVWKSIQKRQIVTITEEMSDQDVVCGTLYIDTWKIDKNIVSFSLIDLIGLLDKTKFYKGEVYNDCPAGSIIDSIMESARVEDYSISEEVAEMLLSGHIPVCTHRDALQQVVFACGAVADCSRQGGISIYIPNRQINSIIGTNRKFMGTTIELDEYVSGVALTYANYIPASETEDIYSDTLPEGISMIEFTDPYMSSSITVTAGTITDVGANFVKVSMAASGACTISGRRYESRKITYTAKVDIVEAGEEENTLSFEGCTLFNGERVKEAAGRLLDYYQMRQIVKIRYLIGTEKTGDWVNIMDVKGSMATTGISQQTIDLAGGFIATATCRGYSKIVTERNYAGEFYTGERGII